MPNVFDQANYPTSEPLELVAGDRWQWKRGDLNNDYPVGDYDLTYSLRKEGDGSVEIEITASESGDDYIVEVGADVTADYKSGTYHWQAFITDSADATRRAVIDKGVVVVKPDLTAATTDPRSHAKKALDAVEAVLEGRASTSQKKFILPSGRSAEHEDLGSLIRFRNFYKGEVRREEQAERIANGLGSNNFIQVRLSRG